MSNLLYGWTYEQWALALVGKDPQDLKDAISIRKEYMKRHKMDPIEKGIVYSPDGDTRPRNYEAAHRIELLAIHLTFSERR